MLHPRKLQGVRRCSKFTCMGWHYQYAGDWCLVQVLFRKWATCRGRRPHAGGGGPHAGSLLGEDRGPRPGTHSLPALSQRQPHLLLPYFQRKKFGPIKRREQSRQRRMQRSKQGAPLWASPHSPPLNIRNCSSSQDVTAFSQLFQ